MHSSFLSSRMPKPSAVGLGNGWSPLADRADLVEAFFANPWGPHKADLQHLVNLMRGADVSRKLILICTKPYEEWVLAQLPVKRGMPVERLEGKVYSSLADAERAAFTIRWEEIFGRPLPSPINSSASEM